jgi:hypothetical protein
LLDIPPNEIPEGSDYQWVVASVHGDHRLGQIDEHESKGWRRVPLSRHSKFDDHSASNNWIVVGGLVLMERPQLLTERAQAGEAEKAAVQLSAAREAIVNPAAWPPPKVRRKTTIREWFVRTWWSIRVWWRDRHIKERIVP